MTVLKALMVKGNVRRRLVYIAGPVDAVDVHRKWMNGELPDYFGDSHIAQFFDLCARENSTGYVITNNPEPAAIYRHGDMMIENCPEPKNYRGLLFHLSQYLWLAARLPEIFRFRPDVLLITSGAPYGIVVAVLKLRRISIIPVLTCAMWPKFKTLTLHRKVNLFFSTLFFRFFIDAAVFASEDIAQQARSLTSNKARFFVFLPLYRSKQFAAIRPAAFDNTPLNIFFAGRIEVNKGVFDLLRAAIIVEKTDPGKFKFHICGDGTQLEALRDAIRKEAMTEVIFSHGFCGRDKLGQIMSECGVVIVPTTMDFEEGFNMVCAEAILSGRPLITSAVCPALLYVRDAAIEVRPGIVEDYASAILRLARDPLLYREKRAATKRLQSQFYDVDNGWGAKVAAALSAVEECRSRSR